MQPYWSRWMTAAGKFRTVVFLSGMALSNRSARLAELPSQADEVLDLTGHHAPARAGQHPPPFLPDPDARRAGRPERQPVQLAQDALSHLGAHDTRTTFSSPPRPPWPNWPSPAAPLPPTTCTCSPTAPGWTMRLPPPGRWACASRPRVARCRWANPRAGCRPIRVVDSEGEHPARQPAADRALPRPQAGRVACKSSWRRVRLSA